MYNYPIINIKSNKPYDIYIGRENKTYNVKQSKWANWYKIGKDGTRNEVVEKHRLRINSEPDLLEDIHELKGKVLGCWCNYPKENCHGINLIELANSKYIKNWFSNMLPFEKPLIYQDIEYKTLENFYQAMKLPKNRLDLRKEIALMSPYEAKKQIKNREKYIWDEKISNPIYGTTRKLSIMRYGLKWKFKKGTDWYRKLMLSKELNLEIVEWNDWNDTFWGKNIKTRVGHNYLGKLITEIRDNEIL